MSSTVKPQLDPRIPDLTKKIKAFEEEMGGGLQAFLATTPHTPHEQERVQIMAEYAVQLKYVYGMQQKLQGWYETMQGELKSLEQHYLGNLMAAENAGNL